MSLLTPVVLQIFNRPQCAEQVLAAVAEVKPKRLFVVADGPRGREEAEQCNAARALIAKVDWDCEVLTDFSPTNLGCEGRVSSGLAWVFNTVEEAIILEDDNVPHPTFFRFCEELLHKYRHDDRVMMINGTNFQFGRRRTKCSYYFSRYSSTWGWASWRRAWRYYDRQMGLWPALRHTPWLNEILGHPEAVTYYHDIFQRTYGGQINTFAYRWKFALWAHNGLVVVPSVNLVTNIGCGKGATNLTNPNRPSANVPTTEMGFPLRHPPHIVRDVAADRFFFEKMYAGNRAAQPTLRQATRRLARLLPEPLRRRLRPLRNTAMEPDVQETRK